MMGPIIMWLSMILGLTTMGLMANPVPDQDLIERVVQSQGRVMQPNQFFAMAFDPTYDQQQPETSPPKRLVSSSNLNPTSKQAASVLPSPMFSNPSILSPSDPHPQQRLTPESEQRVAYRCISRPSRYTAGYTAGLNSAGFFGPGVSVSKQTGNFLGQINAQVVPQIINKYV